MDFQQYVMEDLRKINEEEWNRIVKFRETYKLYDDNKTGQFCLDLKVVKICL